MCRSIAWQFDRLCWAVSQCALSQLCGLVMTRVRRRPCMVLGPQPGAFDGFFATEVFALPRSWRLTLCSSSGRTTRKQRWEHGGTWSTSKKNQNKNTPDYPNYWPKHPNMEYAEHSVSHCTECGLTESLLCIRPFLHSLYYVWQAHFLNIT